MNYDYKHPIGITSQFSFCGLPFRLDTYAGCAFNCSYCFARLRGGNISSKKLRVADPNKIITRFKNSFKNPQTNTGVISEFIQNRMPVHFGGMSDPFQPAEKHYKTSLKVLEYLSEIKYPTIISTKSPLISDEAYLEQLKKNPNIVVQFSFSSFKDSVSSLIEAHSTKPSVLKKTIEILSKQGVKTSIRWQPYIVGLSGGITEFVSQASSLGVFHIGFEHLKMPVEKNKHLWKKVEAYKDINIYYDKTKTKTDGREIILKPEFKIGRALEVKSECHTRKLNFGCADNEIQYLSDSDCCCSGIDLFPEFSQFFKYTISYAVKKSVGNKIERSSVSSEWNPKGSIDKHINSESRIQSNDQHNKISDYLRNRWNNTSSRFNPTSFYGVEYNGEIDDNGEKIYDWNAKKMAQMNISCK